MFEYIKTSLTYHYCLSACIRREKQLAMHMCFRGMVFLLYFCDFTIGFCYCFDDVLLLVFFVFLFCYYRLEKTERAIKTGQSRDMQHCAEDSK